MQAAHAPMPADGGAHTATPALANSSPYRGTAPAIRHAVLVPISGLKWRSQMDFGPQRGEVVPCALSEHYYSLRSIIPTTRCAHLGARIPTTRRADPLGTQPTAKPCIPHPFAPKSLFRAYPATLRTFKSVTALRNPPCNSNGLAGSADLGRFSDQIFVIGRRVAKIQYSVTGR